MHTRIMHGLHVETIKLPTGTLTADFQKSKIYKYSFLHLRFQLYCLLFIGKQMSSQCCGTKQKSWDSRKDTCCTNRFTGVL